MRQLPNELVRVLIALALASVIVNLTVFSYVSIETYTGSAATEGELVIQIVPAPTPPAGPGPSPGGGGGTSRPTRRFFGVTTTGVDAEISVDELRVTLSPGQTVTREIEVRNIGDASLQLTLSIGGIPANIALSTSSFRLQAGQAILVDVFITAPPGTPLGVYTGTILARGDSVQKQVAVIMEVVSPAPFFDTTLVLPAVYTKLKSPTPSAEFYLPIIPYKLVPQVTILDIGRIGLAEVNVTYEVRNLQNNLVYTESEVVTVDRETTYAKELTLPRTTPLGSYVLSVIVDYGGTKSISSQSFEITETNYLAYWILFVVLAAIAVVLYHIYRVRKIAKEHMHKRKRRRR